MTTQYLLFVIVATVLVATPGPDMLFVMSHGLSRGRTAGLASTLGVSTGYVVHSILAAAGLSALLLTTETAFAVVRYAGALYLIWVGIRTLRDKSQLHVAHIQEGGHRWQTFGRGFLTSILNPKAILFFLSFLPQFVQPGDPAAALHLFLLGLTFTGLTIIICSIVALLAGYLGERIGQSQQIRRWMQRVSGSIFLLLGIRLLVPERS